MSPSVAFQQRLKFVDALDDRVESDTSHGGFAQPADHVNYDQQSPPPASISQIQSTYAPSIVSSSASSSPSSVFSVDAASSQTSQSSSVSSSVNSLHVVWEDDGAVPVHRIDLPPPVPQATYNPIVHGINICSRPKQSAPEQGGAALPCDQRLNPRRTNRIGTEARASSAACPRAPPPLVRQSERKVNFVDNLVAPTCSKDSAANAKGVLSLRTFIQETLRRSRTSYSTLQVALYYLIVVKAHVPRFDFTMEQPEDSRSFRALQCGRRMFLSALILASKYLQDRNYSARAWSKISGLSTHEINFNEMTFLSAIKWKLHIGESVFQRWTDIVLKYTVSSQPPTPPPSSSMRCHRDSRNDWKSIIPHLTPDLASVDMDSTSPIKPSLKRPWELTRAASDCASSVEAWRAEHKTHDKILSPVGNTLGLFDSQTCTPKAGGQALPPSIHLASLPTPQMTPQSSQPNTPAAGVASFGSRRASISSAMAQAQDACTTRTTLAGWSNMKGASQRCRKLERMRSTFGCSSDNVKARSRAAVRGEPKEIRLCPVKAAFVENRDLQDCVRGYLGL
ncbi:MAG: hypothetical protein M1817_003758 [Caeruleum heppii]|nr:MAG: hypothetical protein M1817_003758 [Caeruleum heppii]